MRAVDERQAQLATGGLCHPNGMARLALAVFSVACLFLAGCKKGNSLEGTWSGGTGADKVTFTGQNFTVEAPAASVGSVALTGTYTLNKDQLNLTATDVKVHTTDASKQAEYEKQMGAVKPMMIDTVAKTNPITVVFTDADHITLKGKTGQPRSYSRVKT